MEKRALAGTLIVMVLLLLLVQSGAPNLVNRTGSISPDGGLTSAPRIMTRSGSGTYPPPSSGDWIVDRPTVVDRETIVLDGNLTIIAGGSLELRNVTVRFLAPPSGIRGVFVRPGGSLILRDWDGNPATNDTTTLESATAGFGYDLVVETGARLDIDGAALYNLRTSLNPPWAFQVGANNVSINRAWVFRPGTAHFLGVENLTITNSSLSVGVEDFRDLVVRDTTLHGFELQRGTGAQIVESISDTTASIEHVEDFVISGSRFRGDRCCGLLTVHSSSRGEIVRSTFENATETINIQVSSDIGIRDSTFANASVRGVYAVGSNVTIEKVRLQDSSRALEFLCCSEVLVRNSTIANSTAYDFYLRAPGVNVTTVNSSFNKTKVTYVEYFEPGLNGTYLHVNWYLAVRVIDSLGRPVPGALVAVRDVNGVLVANRSTDAAGYVRDVQTAEYRENDTNLDGDGTDPGERVFFTPHNVSATVGGYVAWASPNMDSSKEIVLTMPVSFVHYTIDRMPQLGEVRVDGENHAVPRVFSWETGTLHEIEAFGIDDRGNGTRYIFRDWDDGGPAVHNITAGPADSTITARYDTQFLPAITLRGADAGHTVAVRYVENGTARMRTAWGTWSGWIDALTPLAFDNESSGNAPLERRVTLESFSGPPWNAVTGPFLRTVDYHHQFYVDLTLNGLTPSFPARLQFIRFNASVTSFVSDRWSSWADASSDTTVVDSIYASGVERWVTISQTSWNVAGPISAMVDYVHQFYHSVLLEGTDSSHSVSVMFVRVRSSTVVANIHGSWSGWSDVGTEILFPVATTGNRPRSTSDPHSWLVSGPVNATIRYVESPGEMGANWKPALAATFSAALALMGWFRLRRLARYTLTPDRGRRIKRARGVIVGFVGAEVATGVVSLFTGLLSIPPLLGVGTLVDTAILAVGLCLTMLASRLEERP